MTLDEAIKDEYISKHDAYTTLKDLEATYIYPPVKEAYAKAARRIDEIKAADVQPVKRGKMIPLTDEEKYKAYKDTARDYDGRCSLCNCYIYDTDIFCAECGARMDGDTP